MTIRVSQQDQTVSFPALELSNPLVVSYFDALPAGDRMAALEQAIAVGVMAMRDDRIAAFLAKTERELGANLEWLKHLFEKDQMRQLSATFKGNSGEAAVANALANLVDARRLPDSVQLVGSTAGAMKRNKTGDIVITIGEEDDAPTVVVECKLDKSIRLGDPSLDGLTTGKSDTAWSQLVEARANREADLAIMVFAADNVDRTIGQFTDSVRYVDGIGFIVLVDIARGDFRALQIAYELARQRALARRRDAVDPEVLDVLTRRLCSDLKSALSIRKHIQEAADRCKDALAEIESSLTSASATHQALQAYIHTGKFDRHQMLALLVPHKAPQAPAAAALPAPEASA